MGQPSRKQHCHINDSLWLWYGSPQLCIFTLLFRTQFAGNLLPRFCTGKRYTLDCRWLHTYFFSIVECHCRLFSHVSARYEGMLICGCIVFRFSSLYSKLRLLRIIYHLLSWLWLCYVNEFHINSHYFMYMDYIVVFLFRLDVKVLLDSIVLKDAAAVCRSLCGLFMLFLFIGTHLNWNFAAVQRKKPYTQFHVDRRFIVCLFSL